MRLDGYLEVPATGAYRFVGTSSKNKFDGSFTLFDPSGRFVECKIGSGGGNESDKVLLEKGKHPVFAFFFQSPTGKKFNMQWEGPGITLGDIPPTALSHD